MCNGLIPDHTQRGRPASSTVPSWSEHRVAKLRSGMSPEYVTALAESVGASAVVVSRSVGLAGRLALDEASAQGLAMTNYLQERAECLRDRQPHRDRRWFLRVERRAEEMVQSVRFLAVPPRRAFQLKSPSARQVERLGRPGYPEARAGRYSTPSGSAAGSSGAVHPPPSARYRSTSDDSRSPSASDAASSAENSDRCTSSTSR